MISSAPEPDIAAAERAFRAALDDPARCTLPIVGYGEISTAFAWPPEDPRWVLKSLPRFTRQESFAACAQLIDDYRSHLVARGVPVVETTVHPVDGGRSGFLVQPLLPPGSLAVAIARRDHAHGAELLGRIVEHAAAVVGDDLGFDAQLSNWALVDGDLTLVDVGQPFLRDATGADRLDVRAFCEAYPAPLRPLLTRLVFPGVIAEYHDLRLVLRDLAYNLLKEDLAALVPSVLDHAAAHDVTLTPQDVEAAYRSNRRTWTVLQALRRADRTWQLRVRRRPYPVLLPTEAYRR